LTIASEIFTDKYKLVHLVRRPIPKKVSRLRAWEDIMMFMGHFSILVNCALISFGSKSIDIIANTFFGINPYLEGGGSSLGVTILSDSKAPYSDKVMGDKDQINKDIFFLRLIFFMCLSVLFFFVKFAIMFLVINVPRHVKELIRRHKRIREEIKKGKMRQKVKKTIFENF